MTEIWKPVPGYEGLYEVSDLGRARSRGPSAPVWRADTSISAVKHGTCRTDV